MFDLANDRLNYSELLRPDTGYTLDIAVGMTYSLDLEAFLGVPISLGLFDEVDENNLKNPLYVLEAIRKSADRIAIFCNAGGIKVPENIQRIYSLLERSVFQVKLTKTSNFHPKIWVLKYSQKGYHPYIKLIVMSRNLTFDNSIDISVTLQGQLGKSKNKKNRPISDFLNFIAKFADKKKKRQVCTLADDILKVEKFKVEWPFEDYDFIPIGIPQYSGNNCPLFDPKNDIFIISPFLSDETIKKLTQLKGQKRLVTRKNSVTQTVIDSFDQVYITKDILNYNEYGIKQDIHAKIYYTTTSTANYLYVGSANASNNAFIKNIECLLRLKYCPYSVGYQRFTQDFIPTNDEICPYQILNYVPEIETEDSRKIEIDKALKDAVYAIKRAEIVQNGNLYSVKVHAYPLNTEEIVLITPLQRPDLVQPMGEQNQFNGMLLKELSEFYVLSINSQKLITKIDTQGIPKNRNNEIYRNIIDSKVKFMNYLSFVLSGDLSEGTSETADLQEVFLQTEGKGNIFSRQIPTAIYEEMLRVFHQNPSKLEGISEMIKILDKDIVGKEFRDMYRQFEAAAKEVR